MTMMKFFHCPGSCSLASLIALEEAGAQFEKVIVNLGAGEQTKPEYLAVNPKGKVPALATDRGALTENPAIMTYIAQSFPKAKLAPLEAPYDFARMQSFNAFIASTLQPSLGPLGRPQRYSDDVAAHDSMKRKAIENATHYLGLIEDELFKGPYVLGAEYSVADGYLFVFSDLIARLNLDAKRFSKLLEHRELVGSRPAVRKALG
jgi:glutathione S-transferase